jgi:hypothetical protein
VPISTAHTGKQTVTRTAIDNVGHETTRSCTTLVLESPPELGHCEQAPSELVGGKPVYHGAFKNSKCTKSGSGGRYEWRSGAVSNSFTIQATGVALETAAGVVLQCAAENGGGTISTAKTFGSVVLHLTGCELVGKKCTTVGRTTGEIETKQLEGLIGWLNKAKNQVGLALRPTNGSGPFAEYFCGPSLYTLGGGLTVPLKGNKPFTSLTLKYKGHHGLQKPAGLEGAPEGLTTTPFGEASEPTALLTVATLAVPESLEANTHF